MAPRCGSVPKSALAKACNYTLTLWQRLTRFLDYSVLEFSNNLAENAIRPVALGRKNWIHLGSQDAGPRIAAIVSVGQSCRRLKIPVRDYLGSVLPGLADMPMIESPSSRLLRGPPAENNRGKSEPQSALSLVRRMPRIGSTLAARKPVHALPLSSRSSKPAGDLTFRFANT